MVELSTVRAWHPDPTRSNPDRLVCPVYDTLSEEELAQFDTRPFNAAGFVPRPQHLDLEQFLRQATSKLESAHRSGVYVRDRTPSLYVYGIRYVPPADILETIHAEHRRPEYLLLGLVGALNFDLLGHGDVALHEHTFPDRVSERVALTDATGTTFAPIMAGYHQPDHHLNSRIEQWLGVDRRRMAFGGDHAPVLEATLNGTSHRLWRIDDPGLVEELRGEMRSLRVLILDGHHRFTAAAKRHYAGRPSSPLVMLVNGQDRALQVMPWHRVLPHQVLPHDTLLQAAEREPSLTVRSMGSPSVEGVLARLGEMGRAHRRGFLMVGEGAFHEIHGESSNDVGADFDQLHGFLEDRLGIDPHALEFFRSPRHAIERIRAGDADPGRSTALLLPGLTEKGIEERAFGRAVVMAHKSAMFLPKVAEGVIFAPADGSV